MKQIYLLAGTLFISGLLMAQSLKNYPLNKERIATAAIPENNNAVQVFKSNGISNLNPNAVIWSEDFANGFPGGWTKNNLGADTTQWQYKTPSTNNISAANKLNSTSKANGYMVYNSDASGDDSEAEDNSFKTTAINLSGNTNINLQFEQQFTQWAATTTVIVSDGMNSQTFTINNGSVNPNVGQNASSPNPELVIINISTIAGGKPNVTLEFRWEGNWDYWWQIDDIAIADAASNDLALTDYYFYGYQDSTSIRYYTLIPSLQASTDTILFGGAIKNQGAADQTNAKINAVVTGPSGFSGNSTPIGSVPAGSTDSANLSTTFTPTTDTGTYNITLSVVADQTDDIPTNNSATSSFTVTDTVYARDDDNASSGSWFGSGSTYIIGNLFEINTQDTATSISMLVGSFQNPAYNPDGETMSFLLYDFNVDPPALIASNDFYIIQQADLGTWLTLSIPPTPLAPGWYLAAFETFGDTVLFLTGGQTTPPLTVYVDVDKAGSWSYLNSTPFVRLNTKAPFDACSATLSSSATNVSCNGGNNGAINLTVNGGAGPFSYNWSNGATTQNLSNIVAGSYSVTVTFNTGSCSVTGGPYTVTQPATAISATTSATAACSGMSNGTATATASGGGSTSYTFAWSTTPVQTSATATGLSAGSYTVTVTNANGCSAMASAVVIATSVSATAAPTNTTCGSNNGSATANGSGGTAPYTYLWSNAQTTQTISGLASGSYSVTITDNKGCTGTVTANIGGSTAITVTTNSTDAACGSTDGSATVDSPTGSQYTYLWSGNAGGQTTATASALGAGNYSVTVTNLQDSCTATAVVSVANTGAPAISLTSPITHVLCNGGSNGSIDITVSGGTGTPTIMWTGPNGFTSASEDITNLSAGSYTVVAAGTDSCFSTKNYLINEPQAIVIGGNVTDNTDSGSVNIIVSNASGTPSFSWSGPNGFTSANQNLTGLTVQGTYTVTVTDGNACTATDTFTVAGVVAVKTIAIESTRISVFPNPNSGMFSVKFSNAKGQYVLTMRNVIGQIVYTERITLAGNSTRQIELSDISQGIYFLNISGENVNKTQKIVVK